MSTLGMLREKLAARYIHVCVCVCVCTHTHIHTRTQMCISQYERGGQDDGKHYRQGQESQDPIGR
jgi:hypothetical protein